MAALQRCGCGRVITQPKTGRRRSKCTECSPPDTRARRDKRVRDLGPVVVSIAPGVEAELPPLVAATLGELEAAGRSSTSAGVEALHLARLLDAGGYTAAGAASLAKARRESMAVALAGAKVAADDVDEMARRREDKARRAGS